MKREISSYIDNISLFITSISLLVFPLLFTTITTDQFSLPKQTLLLGVVVLNLFLLGAKMVNEGEVRLRRTPFGLPVFLFVFFALLSSLFSLNRYDSLIAFAPIIFSALSYFVIVNIARTKQSALFLTYSFLGGAAILSIISLLSFFKIYILPMTMAKTPAFSPLGSLYDQAIFLAIVLPAAFYFFLNTVKESNLLIKKEAFVKSDKKKLSGEAYSLVSFGIITMILLGGFFITAYNLATLQKPIILPLETGFQTGFAAISQDTGRVLQGFLFGSGTGTYLSDFSRFKQATFNLNPNLWAFSFMRSSSLILEILATTGVLGFSAFIFLIVRILKELKAKLGSQKTGIYKTFNLSLLLLIVASFLLPFPFSSQALIFIVLGLFSALQVANNQAKDKFFDIELQFVAFKKGLIPISSTPISEHQKVKDEAIGRILPLSFFVLFVIFGGLSAFLFGKFLLSDIFLQKSLVAAAANDGSKTYQYQNRAITTFPYRDAYYRIFSQTNLALANSLASNQPKDQKPSTQTQQTIYTLIQQSINSARTATSISPLTATNWQNLSSIYRNLIGFGQNAESFATLTAQQSILLDPNNPQEYIALGGLYYQLQQWENAQRQFQIAINLKPDLANGYYNLGHVLENKQDYEGALAQYQIVKNLVSKDSANLKKINEEIAVVQQKITDSKKVEAKNPGNQAEGKEALNQPPLNISTPSAKLPKQNPPVKIPAPSTKLPSPTPEPTKAETPTPQL